MGGGGVGSRLRTYAYAPELRKTSPRARGVDTKGSSIFMSNIAPSLPKIMCSLSRLISKHYLEKPPYTKSIKKLVITFLLTVNSSLNTENSLHESVRIMFLYLIKMIRFFSQMVSLPLFTGFLLCCSIQVLVDWFLCEVIHQFLLYQICFLNSLPHELFTVFY